MIPILSIIVPVYNAAPYLPETIAAIAAQTRGDFEAILVDDGSTDESPRIADEAAERDTRFRVIHKANAGVSTARNTGIAAARGKYLAFVDSDDLIDPTFAEQTVGAAERSDADLVICGFVRFRGDWEQPCSPCREPERVLRNTKELVALFSETKTNLLGVSVWCKLYRADVIKAHVIRFDPSISYEEDCCFNVAYYRHVKKTVFLRDCLYRWRQQDASLSKGYRKDTFRFLVNGLHRRKMLLEQFGMGDRLKKADAIFLLVIKNTCVKIIRSNIRRSEKIAEFGVLMGFDDVKRIADLFKETKGGLNRRILRAIRTGKPGRLYLVMRAWTVADRLEAWRNRIKRKCKRKNRQ